MKTKLISDGTDMNTHIYTECGAEIRGVERASFSINAGEQGKLIIHASPKHGVEVVGNLMIGVAGELREVESITLKDGTVLK